MDRDGWIGGLMDGSVQPCFIQDSFSAEDAFSIIAGGDKKSEQDRFRHCQ